MAAASIIFGMLRRGFNGVNVFYDSRFRANAVAAKLLVPAGNKAIH